MPAVLVSALLACGDDGTGPGVEQPLDPDTAPRATVDRFSRDAGNLFVRTADNGLPAAGEAIDLDVAPFITHGLGPDGEPVSYYNFDVQPTEPAPIFVLFREGSSTPVDGQLNIVDVIPGDEGYNDFWQVVRVTVPEDYVANTVTSLEDIMAEGFSMETTDMLVNCPIVPDGSTGSLGGAADGLTRGWYEDQVVFYFEFGEASLTATGSGAVPTSPIFVTFNVNPDQDGGGPASGFRTEDGSTRTHNVVATVPADAAYSPLWEVLVYDNADFDSVTDLPSAQQATLFGAAGFVNCPVVEVGSAPVDPATAPRVTVDRFSQDAGNLFVRTADNGLPAAGEPIDFDQAPFITVGLGPDGGSSAYYNFDVQSRTPAPIYVLFREGSDTPVPGQRNIVDVVPGDAGYNDFWQVVKVTVPDSYLANTVTSLEQIIDAGFEMETTDLIVNCPIVPDGSSATQRVGGGDTGLVQGWYRGEIVYYFEFGEASLTATGSGEVPTSPIYVTFNVNPDQEGGGPGSGFMTESGTDQTHNVLATLPGDAGYSPFWEVIVYDNADFDSVADLASAQSATILGPGPLVNCPVISVP
ncbi:MAG: hypothetical protein R3324_01500 [Halobacteriales archaeon]|nr:hypothetical protein [Halobacteriales archaeon]